jgi:hypothetical protein
MGKVLVLNADQVCSWEILICVEFSVLGFLPPPCHKAVDFRIWICRVFLLITMGWAHLAIAQKPIHSPEFQADFCSTWNKRGHVELCNRSISKDFYRLIDKDFDTIIELAQRNTSFLLDLRTLEKAFCKNGYQKYFVVHQPDIAIERSGMKSNIFNSAGGIVPLLKNNIVKF